MIKEITKLTLDDFIIVALIVLGELVNEKLLMVVHAYLWVVSCIFILGAFTTKMKARSNVCIFFIIIFNLIFSSYIALKDWNILLYFYIIGSLLVICCQLKANKDAKINYD